MKNIHVLPTDKQSRLYHWKGNDTYEGGLRIRRLAGFCDFNSTDTSNQNIYITSDEEIKEGDWCLYLNSLKEWNIGKYEFQLDAIICQKIILTTDKDLINDDVQAIPDEFLEWFVKNPNCEWVEIEIVEYGFDEVPIYNYKIIIPKQEPKQDLEKEMFELEQELDIPSHLRWHNSKPKQETLEEELLQQIKFCLICKNDSQAIRLIEKYGFEKQEKMYSEEEVKKQLNLILAMKNSLLDTFTDDEGFITDKWFKQFKKK